MCDDGLFRLARSWPKKLSGTFYELYWLTIRPEYLCQLFLQNISTGYPQDTNGLPTVRKSAITGQAKY